MKDKRTIINQHDETDEQLKSLSDTSIMLEFSKLLTSIYPHLIKVGTHCYDPYDDISESLFLNFVYSTFSGKYGAIINKHQIHRYGFTLHCYHKINHIEVKPKSFPLTLIASQGQQAILTEEELKDKELIFIAFGDTVNNLSGDPSQVNPETVNFNFTLIAIVDSETGLYFRNAKHHWVANNLIEFELVLEDYNKDEHQYYKQNYYAD